MPKLTDKTELTDVANNDLIHVVDVSDTSSDPAGTSKKSTASNITKLTENSDGFRIDAGTTSTRTLHITGSNCTIDQDLITTGSPTFANQTITTNLTLSSTTASKLLETDSSKNAQSVSALGNYILGSANDVIVTDNADGTVTLTTDHGGSSGTFTNITLTSATANRLLATDGSKELVSVTDLTTWVAGTADQITVTDDADGTITLSTPQDIATTSEPTFASLPITKSFSGDTTYISIDNTSNTSGSDAAIAIQTAGSSGGNPYYWMGISGGSGWYIGEKNDVSYGLYIGVSNYPATNIGGAVPNSYFNITSGGQVRAMGQNAFPSIGGSTLNNAWLLCGSTSDGIGLDNNEIFQKGSTLTIGTIDDQDVIFKPNNTEILRLDDSNITLTGFTDKRFLFPDNSGVISDDPSFKWHYNSVTDKSYIIFGDKDSIYSATAMNVMYSSLSIGGGTNYYETSSDAEFLRIWARSELWEIGVLNQAVQNDSDFYIRHYLLSGKKPFVLTRDTYYVGLRQDDPSEHLHIGSTVSGSNENILIETNAAYDCALKLKSGTNEWDINNDGSNLEISSNADTSFKVSPNSTETLVVSDSHVDINSTDIDISANADTNLTISCGSSNDARFWLGEDTNNFYFTTYHSANGRTRVGAVNSSTVYYSYAIKHSNGNLAVGGDFDADTHLHLQGTFTIDEVGATPTAPTSADRARIYLKGDKYIIQFYDGSTTKYRYLDLSSTNANWTYTTTAP